jgi:DNA polymerase-4
MAVPRILHVDGDSFFASCEIILNPRLKGRPVYVGGGRNGDGIVIAANYEAKKYEIKTGMACFEAKRKCPHGVLCRPHYDEYRRISLAMFRLLGHFSPTLVPISIDEGFMEMDQMDRVFKSRNLVELADRIKKLIRSEVGLPTTMGIGCSSLFAKLVTDQSKPDGLREIPPDKEAEFLAPLPVELLSGIGKRRLRSLHAFGIRTFGDAVHTPRKILEKRLGWIGTQLWLLAHGRYRARLEPANEVRTCISNNTTLTRDEPDYEKALLFLQTQTEKALLTLLREGLKAWEMSVAVRFNDFSEESSLTRFETPQFGLSSINFAVERLFNRCVRNQLLPVRQVRVAFWNLVPLNLEPDLFGNPPELKHHDLDRARRKIEEQFGENAIVSGKRLLLERNAEVLRHDKIKCPFVPPREMREKLDAGARDYLTRAEKTALRQAGRHDETPDPVFNPVNDL